MDGKTDITPVQPTVIGTSSDSKYDEKDDSGDYNVTQPTLDELSHGEETEVKK